MQYFRKKGYLCKGGGKIFHQNNKPGDKISWNDYFISKNISKEVGKDKSLPMVGTGKGWFNWGPIDVEDDKMQDVKTVNWLKSELKKDHEKPFFLACGFVRPHVPLVAPAKYFDLYDRDAMEAPVVPEGDLEDVPQIIRNYKRNSTSYGVTDELHKGLLEAYYASISYMDAQVGRVLDVLDELELSENTIVVLSLIHI